MSSSRTGFTRKSVNGGIKSLSKRSKNIRVKVGIIEGTGVHPNSNGALISEIAWWNEFGVHTRSGVVVPARPFLRTTFIKMKNEYKSIIARLMSDVLLGKIEIKEATSILGMKGQSDVRNTIDRTTTPENSDYTKEKKRSSHPLIDTGLMKQSVSWKAV